jgi:hypothetical protein
MSSWNQIKNRLLTFSQNHPQVNSFGTGEAISFGTDNVLNLIESDRDRIVYPLVFAELEGGGFNNTQRTLSVALYVMDKVEGLRDKPTDAESWKDNEDEVLSDMFEVVSDFVAAFQDDPDIDYTLNPSLAANPFFEVRDDKLCGWRAVLTFELPFSRSVCIIPS